MADIGDRRHVVAVEPDHHDLVEVDRRADEHVDAETAAFRDRRQLFLVGAGVGEMVLFAAGSSARQTVATDNKPVDAVIMAIVDSWEIDGVEKYRKGETDA